MARAGSPRSATSSSWTEVGWSEGRRTGQGGAVWAGSRAGAGCREKRGGWLRRGERAGEREGSRMPALVADTDYVTALCSQVVYEGLVDDTFRIKCGMSPGRHGAPHTEGLRGLCPASSEPACRSPGCSPRGWSPCWVLPEDGPRSERAAGWASPISAAFCSRASVCWDVTGWGKAAPHPSLQGAWISGQMSPLLTRALRCCSTPRTK